MILYSKNYSSNHTGSFSLSLADSSLDCAGVWMGVWTGVFGVECPLVASSAIAFFCFPVYTRAWTEMLCLFSIVSITFPPLGGQIFQHQQTHLTGNEYSLLST